MFPISAQVDFHQREEIEEEEQKDFEQKEKNSEVSRIRILVSSLFEGAEFFDASENNQSCKLKTSLQVMVAVFQRVSMGLTFSRQTLKKFSRKE